MKQVFTLLFCIAFFSCQPVAHRDKKTKEENKLTQLSWMLGKWQLQTPEGTLIEEWSKSSNTQWQGLSYLISARGDTPFKESIRLNYKNDQLTYSPVVSNQNDGKEVNFLEKSFSDSLVIFENLNHDFPQRIIYKRISDTSILAAIEGVQNGHNRREEFAYTKK